MDTVLISVTALSLAMAAGMAVIVARLLREERARSEARVEALTAMAAEPAAFAPLHRTPAPRRAAPSVAAAGALPAAAPARPRAVPRLDEIEIRPVHEVAGGPDLFVERDQSSPWRRRFVVIGSLAAIIFVVGLAIVPNGSRTPTSQAAGAQASIAPDGVPLELVSLRHAQQPDALIITGLVHNPRGAAPLTRVVATAFAFGPDGAFLSSGRAPVDFTTLSPGDESPFRVSIPVSTNVARYRVGFRTEDGGVIAHVDKRAPEALASAR